MAASLVCTCGEAKQHATHATRICDLLGWGICSPSAQNCRNCQDSSRMLPGRGAPGASDSERLGWDQEAALLRFPGFTAAGPGMPI